MTAKISQLWANAICVRKLSPEIEARLAMPLYADVHPLVMEHVAVALLGALAIARIGGFAPFALMAVVLVITAWRYLIIREFRRLPAPSTAATIAKWLYHDQFVDLIWSMSGAVLCGLCLAEDHSEVMRLAVAFVIVGICPMTVFRSSGAPAFAIGKIVLWLLPLLVVVPALELHSLVFTLLGACSLLAILVAVRIHHANIVSRSHIEIRYERLQVALDEREAEVRSFFDNAAAAITEIDLTMNRFVRVNQVFCDMVGRPEIEVLTMDPSAFTHPEDVAERARQWTELQQTGRPFQAERRYCRPDGSVVWGRVSVSVLASDHNRRPVRLLSIVQNITDLKNAEVELRRSQDLLNLALEIGGVGTFHRNYVAGFIYCGRETRMMLALPSGEDPIPADTWLATVLSEDRPRMDAVRARAHAERRSTVLFDYRFVHPEKGIRYAETRSRVEYDASGLAITSVGVVIDVTERRQTERRLAHLAHHDPLTDLPNRSLFRLRLDEALEKAEAGEPCAVLYLDLDHFKDINDTFGHPVGDALLCAVTVRLRAACRPTDTVARLGGDEFAIIQAPVRHRADVATFAKRVISILNEPYDVDGHRLTIGTSVGITIAPDDGIDADRLLRSADMALYGAKDAGRGRHKLFESAMDDKLQARRGLDTDLRHALTGDQLELFYQPQVSVATRRVRGFEALIRWRHPVHGLVMPDQFIPHAESNGLIVPIGGFVLHRACAQAAMWESRANVSVNLSAAEFGSPDIVQTVASALRRSGLDPRRLELEITETTMLQNTDATIETLDRLKALGVRISIDDFGIGFSSLSYLQRFPFDKVKIDRSFISPLGRTRESLAIVGAVAKLCAGLDMETTAEGVETENHFAILSEVGCTEAQGYYFSRPRPANEVATMIEQIALAACRHEAETVAA